MDIAEKKVRRTLYGGQSSNTVAYCHYHHLSITAKQLQQKGCLRRQCGALERHAHPYWDERERCKEQRQARKEWKAQLPGTGW